MSRRREATDPDHDGEGSPSAGAKAAQSRPRNGGLPARRAVVRWAGRVFRREWRQQVLLLALLTFAVAGALLGIAAVYNTPASFEARFGTADRLITYHAGDPSTLDADVAAARAVIGTVDVIGHRNVQVPGLTRGVELREQDPHGPYGAPMLRLLAGRYPSGPGEVAVTDQVATILRAGVGRAVTLDGTSWTVVGLIENPGDLNEEFLLAAPGQAGPLDSVTILAMAGPGLDTFQRNAETKPRTDSEAAAIPNIEICPNDERTLQAVGVFALVALAMLLVCFVAVGGFIAMAQRRMRQFGLLAATGATERHVRLVLLASGATAGAIAAVAGAALAVPLWIALVPLLELTTGHRIARLDVPWWLLGATLLLGVVTATGAAWWPGRAAARVPVTQALSLRPPRPRPAHRSEVVGGLLLATGVVCLRLAHQTSVPLIMAGTVVTLVGLPFLSHAGDPRVGPGRRAAAGRLSARPA